MPSLTWWTWVWVNSRSWWWTGRPGMLQSMGSQRVRHNWATELNWQQEWGSQLALKERGEDRYFCIFFFPPRGAQLPKKRKWLPPCFRSFSCTRPIPIPPPAFLPHPCCVAVLLQGTGPKASAGCQLDLSAWEAHCYPLPAPLNTHTRTHTLMPMAPGTSGFVFCHLEGSFHTFQCALAA